MVDNFIPRNAPGIAGFATESIGGAGEPRFGEGVPTTTTENVPASTEFELYEVVSKNSAGDLVTAVYGTGGAASLELTFSGVGTADDTVTIGSKVYTLKAAPTTVANEVKIGASAAETAANLIAAINGGTGSGTLYGSLTVPHTQVSAAQGSTTAKVMVTALVSGDEGNAIAVAEAGTGTAWAGGGTALAGGDDDAALKPYGITTAPVLTGVSQRTTIDVYRGGHWDMDQLVWDASFDTDDKKKKAFEGSLSPNIFISKKKFGIDAIDV